MCTFHYINPPSLAHPVSEDKSDSVSSEDEIAFSSDEEDGLHTNAVDHYESLVSAFFTTFKTNPEILAHHFMSPPWTLG